MLPILYSFRRCPYAMRARLALAYCAIAVAQREVSLKNKPTSLLAYSAKGTVPVLILPTGSVLEQSLDIMLWAMTTRSLSSPLQADLPAVLALIQTNDGTFKAALDGFDILPALKDRDSYCVQVVA